MLPDQQATPAYERLKSIKFYWQLEWTYGWAIGDRRSMSWLWTGVSAKYFAEALTISACGLFFFFRIYIYIYLHTYMYNRECEVVLLTLVDWLITKMRKAKQCNICKLVTLTFFVIGLWIELENFKSERWLHISICQHCQNKIWYLNTYSVSYLCTLAGIHICICEYIVAFVWRSS